MLEHKRRVYSREMELEERKRKTSSFLTSSTDGPGLIEDESRK
jgi:hypothetical protein